MFVPFTVSEPAIELRAVASPFATPRRRAGIERGGWTLPVATIDVARPVDAAGIGGLAVRAKEALTIGWRGLRDGSMTLPSPWVALAPGLILVTDIAATGALARQRLRLWQESNPPGRSTVDLRYAEPGQLIYLVAATGSEVVIAVAAAQARLDRPVDVRGTPLPVDTRRSLAAFTYTDAARFAFLYDEDILIDVLKPGGPASPAKGSACALAIRNALFTTTPVNSLLLFATLRDEEMIETGVVILGMGLYTMLPTLPDPYAANVAPLGRNRGRLEAAAQVTQLLVASVTWQKAASDHKPDDVRTAFAFAPVGTQAQSVATWGALSAVAIGPRSFADAPPVGQATRAAASRPIPVGALWDSFFAEFAQEQFALLDVSTNADQLGVSFAYFDPRRHPQSEGRPFDEVYGGGPAAPANALEIHDLDLSAQGRFVRAFTVPQISWDPILNLTKPDRFGDPPQTLLLFPNDGGPTRLLSDDTAVVPIAPIPVSKHLVDEFAYRKNGFTGALFTLPYGLVSFAEFSRENQFDPALGGSKLTLNQPHFEAGDLVGGIQLRADAPAQQDRSPTFRGCTVQLSNLSDPTGAATGTGTLGASVSTIFNEEFFFDGGAPVRQLGVPLTRIDFSGYGASTFSHWEAPKASIASTSQARFDVFVGRTAHEVIQVRTLLYPWGVRVVRTITLFRASSGFTYRYDSGWQPESDGLFNFGYVVKKKNVPGPGVTFEDKPSPYEVHPGVVRGVFKVRNIHETDALPPFVTSLNKANGDTYIDQDNFERIVDGSTPIEERAPGVLLQPVYFDGDIQIDGLTAGGMDGRVPSKGILGYVQLKPRGEPLSPAALRELLDFQFGSIGAAVDCEIDVAGSGQGMRVSRVDISPSVDAGGGSPIFVVAARGALVLSSGGAWSVVRHDQGSGEVSPVDANARVPLIRRGRLNPAAGTTDAGPADLFRVANPIDLVRPLASDSRNYGLLQTTGTQKALFRQPSFQQGVDQLQGAPPDYADAYRLVNTKGIFPNVQDAVAAGPRCIQDAHHQGGLQADRPGQPGQRVRTAAAGRSAQVDRRVVPEDLRRVPVCEERQERHGGTTRRAAVRIRRRRSRGPEVAVEGERHRHGHRPGLHQAPGDHQGTIRRAERRGAGFPNAGARVQRQAAAGDRHPADPGGTAGRRLRSGDAEGARCCDEQLGRELELCVPRAQGNSGRAVPARKAVLRATDAVETASAPGAGCLLQRVAHPDDRRQATDSHRRGVPGVRRQPVGDVRQPGGGHGVRRWHGGPADRGGHEGRTRHWRCGSGSAPSWSSACRWSAMCRCCTWWASRCRWTSRRSPCRRSCCSADAPSCWAGSSRSRSRSRPRAAINA